MKATNFKLILIFLCFLSLGFATFITQEYLYPSEKPKDIAKSTITVDGIDYQLITINSKEVFLLKNNEPIKNQEEITSIISKDYKTEHFLTDEEVQEIKDLVYEYDASRTDEGKDFLGLKEEIACRAVLYLITVKDGEIVDLFPCRDLESCQKASAVFCVSYAEGQACSSYMQFLDPITDFSYASNGNDEILGTAKAKLENMTAESAYNTLKYINDNIPTLKTYAQTIESSIFRWPYPEEECKDCYGACPRFNLTDETTLVTLGEKIDRSLAKASEYNSYKAVALGIYEETNNRFEYKENSIIRDEYMVVYEPLKEKLDEVVSKSEELLSIFQNQTLQKAVDDVTYYDDLVNESLESFNFTNMDLYLGKLDFYLENAELKLNKTNNEYQETYIKIEEVGLFILSLEVLDIGDSASIELESLKEDKKELDALMAEGHLSPVQFANLSAQYAELDANLDKLLGKYKDNIIFERLRAFGRKVNSNLNELIDNVYPLTYEEKLEYTPHLPMAFSLLNFFTFTSLAFFALVIFLSYYKGLSKPKLFFSMFTLLIFIVLILAFSVGLYFYLDKTSTSADFTEFIYSLSVNKYSAIVLDTTDTTALDSMNDCSAKLATTIESLNKSVNIYYINADTCKKNNLLLEGLTPSDCFNNMNGTIFLFGYSETTEKPEITASYVNQFAVNANKEYYNECDLASILGVVANE